MDNTVLYKNNGISSDLYGITNANINITATNINIKYTDMNNKNLEYNITLDEIKNSNSFKDASIYMIYITNNIVRAPINILAQTSDSRSTYQSMRFLSPNIAPIIFMYVKSKNITSFLDTKLILFKYETTDIKYNLDNIAKKVDNIFDNNHMIIDYGFPTFKLEELNRTNDYITMQITALESDNSICKDTLEVYLESNGGYLPKTKIDVTGNSTFKFYTLGLDSSDKVSIKAGYRFWRNISKYTLEV